MFTGIIENIATLKTINEDGTNKIFTLDVPFGTELKVDQSLAHNGVCLTVTAINKTIYTVVAISETLDRTNLGDWKEGERINVERCMPADGRFDGHIVQGHVDSIGICKSIENKNGSWEMHFQYLDTEYITVEKGSICINGISLTIASSYSDGFSVAIIPYTFENTNLGLLDVNDKVNLEFDIIGKYLKKLINN